MSLNPQKVGVLVECVVCHQRKQPRGRSSPHELYLCDQDCHGYEQAPHVGSLWPNESEADFGYPVGDVGTRLQATDEP